MSNPSEISDQGRDLARSALIWTLALLALPCLALLAFGQLDWALAVALGAMLGWLNIAMLARGVSAGISKTLEGIDASRRERGEPSLAELDAQLKGAEIGAEDPRATDPKLVELPKGFGALTRLGLVVAAAAGLFLLRPAQPGGIAIGVIVSLAGLAVAAMRRNSH